MRWSELMSEYDFDISYVKGTMNNVAYALHIFSMLPLKTNLQEKILKL